MAAAAAIALPAAATVPVVATRPRAAAPVPGPVNAIYLQRWRKVQSWSTHPARSGGGRPRAHSQCHHCRLF